MGAMNLERMKRALVREILSADRVEVVDVWDNGMNPDQLKKRITKK